MIHPIPVTPPHVSVNRVRIVDLPGIPIDDEVRGQRADHLLSNRAITRYTRERAEALKLPAAFAQDSLETRMELPRFVDECLSRPENKAQSAAWDIGRRLGRNLGHILLTLHRGDSINRAARTDWTDRDWEHWGRIERVWLGGGLVSGQLGTLIMEQARAFLAEVGYAGQPRVARAIHPHVMTLLGAGRYLPSTTRQALCLDFGHTLVKRACLGFENGVLTRLRSYTSLATDLEWLDTSFVPNPTTGRQVLEFVTDTIAKTLDECLADEFVPGADVMLSVAAYVREGQLLGNGLYANLSTLVDDVRPLLAEAVRPLLAEAVGARTGRTVKVHLIHDGTAACAVYAGTSDAAVMLIGTALGIGFPPTDTQGLWSLGPTLKLD
jgi:hypothetical protein